MNRTCFNGLYRVNSKGKFNVPFGKYVNPKICDEENLIKASEILKNVKILNNDFEKTDEYIDENTFVYFDPPYRPLSNTSSFNSYSKEIFNDEVQERLADFYKRLHKKKAKLMLSNSDPKNTCQDDDFFDDLYSDFNILRVNAKRMINSNASKRGNVTELLILNYRGGVLMSAQENEVESSLPKLRELRKILFNKKLWEEAITSEELQSYIDVLDEVTDDLIEA